MIRRLGFVLACLLVCTVHAQPSQRYYRWKDAQGVTHYGDMPPAGVKATAVDIRGSATAAPAEVPSPVAGGEGALEKAEAGVRAQNCSRAKDNLRVLDGKAMLVDRLDPTQARRMTPDEIEDARRRANADVAEYCGKAP